MFINNPRGILSKKNNKMKINFLKGLKEGNEEFTKNITIIVNSILLSIAYFIGVGFTFLLAKLFNKRFLEMKIEKDKKTYWKEFDLSIKPLKEYYKQF